MKLEIVITGKKVHDVGYRHFLLTQALTRGIGRLFAYNAYAEDMQAVIVHVEGEEEQVADFLDFVKTNFPSEAKVSDVKHEEYIGKVMDIDQYMHLAQVEQLDKGIPAILEIRENTSQIPAIKEYTSQIPAIKEYTSQIPAIKEYTSQIPAIKEYTSQIPAIKENTSQIPAIKENTEKIMEHTSEIKQGIKEILVKQDETIHEIKSLRLDLKSYMDSRFKEIFFEIGRIKEKIGLS